MSVSLPSWSKMGAAQTSPGTEIHAGCQVYLNDFNYLIFLLFNI